MIYRVFSDLPTFKTLTFSPGLNVLLAEKSDDATRRQTRNRAGKSSLVQLIRFLTGGQKRIFGKPPLVDHWFGMEFDLGAERVIIEHTGAPRQRPRLSGAISDLPTTIDAQGDHRIAMPHWKAALGRAWFALPASKERWRPKLGALRAYFMRSFSDGGMFNPTQHFGRQSTADEQLCLSYLLGLDWTIARDWQAVRAHEKTLETMRKGLEDGALGESLPNAAVLDSQIVIAAERAERLRAQLATFRVVDEYHALEAEASELTRQLGQLADDNTLDQLYLREIQAALSTEAPPPVTDLEAVYAQAGIALPDLVQRRFDDVARFHAAVIANRHGYLQDELGAAQQRIHARDEHQQQLDARRAEVMQILDASGALEHFTALQGELARVDGRLEVLKEKHTLAKALETKSLAERATRATLQARLHRDLDARHAVRRQAILLFESISKALYGPQSSGHLVFNPTPNGLKVQTHIQGSRSRGVTNMQIFCFDMMLTVLNHRRGRGPGFLIHDSHLFDGVDGRQVGTALAIGARLAAEEGFQYIVTLNTDDLPAPHAMPPGFDLAPHFMHPPLSDAAENGGLFGIRFES